MKNIHPEWLLSPRSNVFTPGHVHNYTNRVNIGVRINEQKSGICAKRGQRLDFMRNQCSSYMKTYKKSELNTLKVLSSISFQAINKTQYTVNIKRGRILGSSTKASWNFFKFKSYLWKLVDSNHWYNELTDCQNPLRGIKFRRGPWWGNCQKGWRTFMISHFLSSILFFSRTGCANMDRKRLKWKC